LDELRPKYMVIGENTLYHGIYLTLIFNYFGVDHKSEEFISRKVFNYSDISFMKIPYMFHPYETLPKKRKDWLMRKWKGKERKRGEEEEEEEDEMEIKEEVNEETSLESIEYPINPNNPSNKTLLKNQKIILENQKIIKRIG